MRKFFKDFKAFITKGNVLDLAVGMIIGAAFNAIVKSLVNDVLMPVIGLAYNGDVSSQYWVLRGTATTDAAGNLILSSNAVLMYWGRFLQNIIDFLIIGFTLFVIVRLVVKFQKVRTEKTKELLRKISAGEELTEDETQEVEETLPKESEEVKLLREIRDSLKKEDKVIVEETI